MLLLDSASDFNQTLINLIGQLIKMKKLLEAKFPII